MTTQLSPGVPASNPRVLHVGSVSFLNAKPLIFGLDANPDLSLSLDVPSRLLAGLHDHRFDIALLPIIDYQRLEGLRLVPSGAIGSDGPTLTVRIFSRVPIPQIRTLACDTDSRTSIALARVILGEKYKILPRFIDLGAGENPPSDARLLIGDKVVCEEPPGFEYQLDLGLAWKELTGLPFVFATWMARKNVDLRDLPQRLELARRRGLDHVNDIIAKHAIARGWPAGVALQYLTCYMKYDIAEPQLQAMRRFYELAAKYELIPTPVRAIEIYQGS